jgi:hypothetical protein
MNPYQSHYTKTKFLGLCKKLNLQSFYAIFHYKWLQDYVVHRTMSFCEKFLLMLVVTTTTNTYILCDVIIFTTIMENISNG